jgi:DsbC/DsbD-like thiol-disulfide interchange protein
MPKGEHLKGKKNGVPFTKDNQPPPENKSGGKQKVKTIKDALLFIGEQAYSKKNTHNGEFEFSMEAEIIYKQAEKALQGDTKAAEFMAKIGGWEKPKQVEQKNTHEMIGLAAEFVDRS